MKTRIRHYRKLRRFTQSDLADRIGTTAATVSRLETADMKVSMGWLQRFADVFNVQISDLIDEPGAPGRVPCLGEISRTGALLAVADDGSVVTLEAPAKDPIALRIGESIGPYCAGDVVIADRMAPEHAARALGRDCLVEVGGQASGFGRFVSSDDGRYFLVPPEPGAQARSLPTPDWIAPVVMLIRYF
ncbi:MAG: helix-turn-helix domain-containing protein [Parvibaculum sp.]|uniref:helix-turn-helix domain-containing protein n=1 Tax=Parvibaculum sp. TaxID=2024848 RepID=UPI0025E9040D|nr:helix-turn-helix transcriptional regulator [Parvibaculum sp.]MCE9649584.1 helix-turn-helix domain-containing protein [Parvibaculum sp.]